MPINTDIRVPFNPQEGVTGQILSAIQLANEHAHQQQQMQLQQQGLGLQQQQLAQQAPLIQAQTAQHQAETQAIPKKLELENKRVEAENAARLASINAESEYHKGLLGLGQERANETASHNAAKLELESQKNAWEAQKASADVNTARGRLDLQKVALGNLKQFQDKEIMLRQDANSLHEKGLETQAQQMITRADQVANQVGFWRSALGEVGLMPEAQIPPAAGGGGAAPKSKPPQLQNPY